MSKTNVHAGRHGQLLRGLPTTAGSNLPQGKFGRMFRALPAAQFGDSAEHTEKNLRKLARAMRGDPKDKPKDGRDDEESGIPALYTYFGQFIDHDITFDPASSLQQFNDPDALIDYRTPALDLDSVYGRGPDDQPYLYTRPPDRVQAKFFLQGEAMEGGGDSEARDLPRNSDDPARALIGDPRNDENAIISQLQALLLRFHNRMAREHNDEPFDEVQRLVRWHYQYVVVNDFLERIVSADVLEQLKTGGEYDFEKLKFFSWRNDPFMPVEFSVAAYRLGHSMVRPGYRLNDHDETLLPIFGRAGHALGGFGKRNKQWGIDWARFINIEERAYEGSPGIDKRRLQFAYRIDTSLVFPLHDVGSVVSDDPHPLALRNLLRGWRLGLPSGQDVAHCMNVDCLKDEQILIGAAIDKNPQQVPITDISDVFEENCPLWVYILAEAQHHSRKEHIPVSAKEPKNGVGTPKLGPVGGRIVAEVLLGLLFGDHGSYLSQHPAWKPDLAPKFKLPEFVKYALGQ